MPLFFVFGSKQFELLLDNVVLNHFAIIIVYFIIWIKTGFKVVLGSFLLSMDRGLP